MVQIWNSWSDSYSGLCLLRAAAWAPCFDSICCLAGRLLLQVLYISQLSFTHPGCQEDIRHGFDVAHVWMARGKRPSGGDTFVPSDSRDR